MARLARYTQQVFASSAATAQIAEYGSFANGTPATYSGTTITPALVQGLTQYLSGWFSAVEGAYSPAIEDMNALCYLFAYQLSYLMNTGIAEWDSGTTYSTGNIVAVPVVVFTVSSANATAGATYTNNSKTFTVQNTISADNRLVCTYTGQPTSGSGTLTKATGTGDSTISYTAEQVSTGLWISIVDANLNNAVTNTSYWMPYIPSTGKAFQRLSTNSTATGTEFTYHTINDQIPLAAYTIPSGYNLMIGFLTISTGLTWTVTGSMCASGALIVDGTLLVNGTVHCN